MEYFDYFTEVKGVPDTHSLRILLKAPKHGIVTGNSLRLGVWGLGFKILPLIG